MPNTNPDILAEPERVKVLRELKLLEMDEAGTYDRITRIASRLLKTPVSLVSMVAEDYQQFLGQTGLNEELAATRQTPISHSFCQHVVAARAPLIVEDAREHPLVFDNLAIEDLDVIAYLGVPIVTSEGIPLGSLCAIDHQPRHWTEDDIELITELSESVVSEIELRSELQQRRQAQAQLTQFIREREQLRIVKQMTQSISHELRTPLSSMFMRLDMLKSQISDDKLVNSVEAINNKMQEVRNVLDSFSKLWSLDTQGAKLKDCIDLHHVIQSAIDHILEHDAFHSLPITIDSKLLAENCSIQGQANFMKLALVNILENALIFNKSDDKRIVIETKINQDQIRVSITDNGMGIPEEDLPFIFEPLYKVNKARTREDSISGLGLTIAQQIVTEHGGEITVKSEIAQGSTFIITLPLISDL